MAHYNLFGALGCGPIDREHLIGYAEQGVERGLDRIPAVDGRITVQDFLQNFGISNQALAVGDQVFQQSLSIGFVRMGRANDVHRDIRINE